MLKILMYFLLFCVSTISCNLDSINDIPYDIIIIAGQSNTHSGIGLNSKIDKSDKNIFELGRVGILDHMIINAKEPLQHHTAKRNKIGFGLSFAKIYKKDQKDNHPILIIPCGFSGSSLIDDWSTKDFLYNDLLDRVRFIKQKHPNSTIKAVLWHQGESDTGRKNYDELLDHFINSIRKDLKSDNLPFILGGMVPFWVNQNELRVKQQNFIKNTPKRLKNTAYADPELPFIIKKVDDNFDKIHYDANGQRELGKRYFDAYTSLKVLPR